MVAYLVTTLAACVATLITAVWSPGRSGLADLQQTHPPAPINAATTGAHDD
ncbi:MAG: hypothetical protein H7Y61_03030 [Rhizobiales bacterium]|nr:hypothetical protein [Rhizobacter sp.]